MEKKFKADNKLGNIFWIITSIVLLTILIYKYISGDGFMLTAIYFGFTIVFILSTTVKEIVITENGFVEIRFVLKILNKNRRIPIGDMVAVKKMKPNQVRVDKVRGFEVFRIKSTDTDAFITELKERNPRIIVAGNTEES